MISDDRYLERIVAGIQTVTSGDAKVNWNEKINGRQFDVVVRFRIAMVNYLVVIEVRNKRRPTEATAIESFVTKSTDHHADKAIFVSAAGFQEGAITVAKKHAVELFTIRFLEDEVSLPQAATIVDLRNRKFAQVSIPEIALGEKTPAIAIHRIQLNYGNGSHAQVPDEPSQIKYYCNKTRFPDGRSLIEVLIEHSSKYGKDGLNRIEFLAPTTIKPPDEFFFHRAEILSIEYARERTLVRKIQGDTYVEPSAFAPMVEYCNVLSGEKARFAVHDLPLGDSILETGKYYFTTNPLIYTYCDSISGRKVTLFVVESFQGGEICRARLTTDSSNANRYIRVTDERTLARLKVRLEQYVGSSSVALQS